MVDEASSDLARSEHSLKLDETRKASPVKKKKKAAPQLSESP
jgi:hypothetical protein